MKKICCFVSVVCIIAVILFAIRTPVPNLQAKANDEPAINKLNAMNLIDGFEDGGLHGERNLTRAQFAKIMVTAFPKNYSSPKDAGFPDVPSDHWAYQYVCKATYAGWLTGFDDGTFRPDDEITYEQALTIMCRALDIITYTADYPGDYVSAAIENSISDKVNALTGEILTREMAAQIILNSLDYNERENMEINTAKYYAAPPSFAPAAPYTEKIYMGMEPSEMNTEQYQTNAENVFKDTLTSPLSTFSIDTDTASYSNFRRFVLNGQNISNGSIRSEELINYFDYAKATIPDGDVFGVEYTVAKCPWNESNNIAMLTVSGEELTTPKPSNIVLLIDISGSMYSANKLPLVKQSLSLLLDKLGNEDTISIVTYASGTGVALEPTPATEKEKILDVLNGLSAGGATAGASGINLAYELAEKNKIDGNNRVIICTDGDFNVGISSQGDLEKLISEKKESGIFLSVLGFGMGNYKDTTMETLADKGNGNYAYIDNLREAKKVLVDEMSKTIYTIAKDVKIQVEFNPAKVSEYRLIGYENRLLNNEDFENDAKDAGELGAGATVTVLYEIVPQSGNAQSNLKYQTSTTTGSDELMTVKIRHKLPEGDESILSEYPISGDISSSPDADFNFACAVAELGMILNESEYVGTSDYTSVINLARASLGDDPYGIRNEFVQLVDLLRLRNY